MITKEAKTTTQQKYLVLRSRFNRDLKGSIVTIPPEHWEGWKMRPRPTFWGYFEVGISIGYSNKTPFRTHDEVLLKKVYEWYFTFGQSHYHPITGKLMRNKVIKHILPLGEP